MQVAEWDSPFVANFFAQRARLCVAEMVCLGRLAPTDETGEGRDIPEMLFVSYAFWPRGRSIHPRGVFVFMIIRTWIALGGHALET